MRLGKIIACLSMFSAALLIGCGPEMHTGRNSRSAAAVTSNAMPSGAEPAVAPNVRQDMYNLAQLDVFPLPVRTAFERDFPNTAITNTATQNSSAGPLLYRITYVRNGEPHEVWYNAQGQILAAPLQPGDVKQNQQQQNQQQQGTPAGRAPAGATR